MGSQKKLFEKIRINEEEEKKIVGFTESNIPNKSNLSKQYIPLMQANQMQSRMKQTESLEAKEIPEQDTMRNDQKNAIMHSQLFANKYISQATKDTSSTLNNAKKVMQNIELQKIEIKKEELDNKAEKSPNTEHAHNNPFVEINPEMLNEIRKEKLLLKDTMIETTSADDVLEKKNKRNIVSVQSGNLLNKPATQEKNELSESKILLFNLAL